MNVKRRLSGIEAIAMRSLEQSALATVLTDNAGNILFSNKAAADLWGYGPGEMPGRSIADLTQPALIPAGLPDRNDASRDVHILRKDGQDDKQDVRATLSISRAEADGDLFYMIVARDASADMAARERDRLLLMAVRHGNRPVLVLDEQRRIVEVNDAFTESIGYTIDEVRGQEPIAFFSAPFMSRKDLAPHRDKPWGRGHLESEAIVRCKDGRDVWMRIASAPIADDEATGRRGYSVDMLTDITEQKQITDLERKVQEALMSNLPFKALGDYICRSVKAIAPDIIPSILLVDRENRLRLWAVSMLPKAYSAAVDGLTIGEAVGSCGTAATRGERVLSVDIEHDPLWAAVVDIPLAHGLRACWSYPIKARDGHVVGTFAFYAKEPRGPGEFHEKIIEACVHLCALAIEREDNRLQIARMVKFDMLTGLPNRTALHEHVDAWIKKQPDRELALFCLDIDRFKDVNETLGHVCGDQVLVMLANRLRERLLPGEFLAREGDQLIVAAPHMGDLPTAGRVEELQRIIAEPLEVSGHWLSLTASAGISCFPESGHGGDELLSNARNALVAAKASGGNACRFFRPDMNETMRNRLLLGAALKRAVASNGLTLKYQPQVHMDGSLCGVEALARWRDPDFGDVPPDRFIELAEETGLIDAIGRWTLREACRQLAEWRDTDVAVPVVSVNLSPLNFRWAGLPDYIAELQRSYGLPGDSLTIEITESATVSLTPDMLEIIRRLRASGAGLSVDDFGTGFSSLSNLANLPVTEVKIDKSFIDRCLEDTRYRLLVDAVVGIGRSLGITVVAEGVETETQQDFLGILGCPVLQGYLFSPAIDAAEIPAWLAARQDAQAQPKRGASLAPADESAWGQVRDSTLLKALPILRRIVDALPFGVSWATIQPNPRIRYSTAEFDRIFGYPPGHFRTPDDLIDTCYVHERQRQQIRKSWRSFNSTQERGVTVIPETELDILTADGSIRSIIHFGLILHEQKLAIALFKDISVFKQENEMLKSVAFLDPLTGTMNRRGLKEKWQQVTARPEGRHVALLLIDLDGFKRVNDTYGHDTGDTVLIAVADRMRAAVRSTDAVSRIGGDEFVVLVHLPDDEHHVEDVCARIVDSLNAPIDVDGTEICVGASLGGCVYPQDAADLREALQRADKALYRIKKNGKRNWGLWSSGKS